MFSVGRSTLSSPLSTSIAETGVPSTLIVGTSNPASAARAHARRSASLAPKNGGGSTVLHSDDSAAMKTFVPGFTVHVSEVVPRGANGATTPPRSTHGLPPPKGFWAVGVSSSASQTAPRLSPSLFSGTKTNQPTGPGARCRRRDRRSPCVGRWTWLRGYVAWPRGTTLRL
jgi:hypothetical protein